jgi:hypothetical protein
VLISHSRINHYYFPMQKLIPSNKAFDKITYGLACMHGVQLRYRSHKIPQSAIFVLGSASLSQLASHQPSAVCQTFEPPLIIIGGSYSAAEAGELI